VSTSWTSGSPVRGGYRIQAGCTCATWARASNSRPGTSGVRPFSCPESTTGPRRRVVVGVPDEQWGERVVAFVETRDPISLADVRDLVDPREWAPRQLVVLEKLPRLPNGKPDRVRLRAMA